MRRWLEHWVYLSLAAGWLLATYLRAVFYFKNRALADLRLPPERPFLAGEKRRWRHYFYGVTYLAGVFGLLHGRSRRPVEKHLFANLAALSFFFDDLADTFRLHGHSSLHRLDNPEEYGQVADTSGLALHFLQNTYAALPPADLPRFKHYLLRVFNLETAGRQQSPVPPAVGELGRLTAEKGGCSVLLFRCALRQPLPEPEEKALYEFGALVQLCDDIFDLWFDHGAGVSTVATLLAGQNDPVRLRCVLEKQMQAVCAAFRQTPCPAWRAETALRAIHVLAGITRVCVHRYGRLVKKHGMIPLHDRAAMVVDMERWRNRLRAGLEVCKPL